MHPAALLFALAATLVPSAFAHGHVRSITIDGTLYKGNDPNLTNFTSPIRAIDDVSPVKGAMNRDINCGKNAQIAALVAPAKPGSVVTFDWAGGTDGTWPHNIGPVLAYLSKCGNTTCDKFDAINAQWFKISQQGQRQNDSSQWVQQDLFNGKTTSVTLPQNVAPGDYLLRSEIVALHLATTLGGAEFYPSCSQLRISAPNNTDYFSVDPSETVSLPGAYSDTDPGIFVPTLFDPVKNYAFPGPNISNVVTAVNNPFAALSNSTTGSPVNNPFAALSNSTTGSPANTSCSTTLRPRQVSRIMAKFRRPEPTLPFSD